MIGFPKNQKLRRKGSVGFEWKWVKSTGQVGKKGNDRVRERDGLV